MIPITDLFLSNKIFDPIRQKEVAATPEEKVRQALIDQMIRYLGFPKSLLAVEKNLSAFIQIPKGLDPLRRIDLLVLTPHKTKGLYPLILIECKALDVDREEAEKQLLGYNQWVCAPFLAVATPGKIKTLWKEEENLRHVPFLPCYQELCTSLT